jgi:hypothetical protein
MDSSATYPRSVRTGARCPRHRIASHRDTQVPCQHPSRYREASRSPETSTASIDRSIECLIRCALVAEATECVPAAYDNVHAPLTRSADLAFATGYATAAVGVGRTRYLTKLN